VKYEVEAMPEGNQQLRLMSRAWPAVESPRAKRVARLIPISSQ